jgi:hypothetical protein
MDCIRCQGKYYKIPLECGHSFCPIISKLPQFKTKKLEKENFVGTSPSVFVGRYGYPNVNVGVMALPETIVDESEIYDSPKQWSQRNMGIGEVLDFRSVLINTRFQSSVKKPEKYVELVQEVSMASKPVDVEYFLYKKPVYQVKVSDVDTVQGARAELKKASITSNVKIDPRVEYVVNDELKATESLKILYDKGFDENFLTRIFSVGNLGVKKKLVPTRFSITAIDDSLGKGMIDDIRDYPVSDYKTCFGSYLGNDYLIFFFPKMWSYELFEMYMPQSLLNPYSEVKYSTDFESYNGRKTYAEQCVGGYYSVRMAILEKLRSLKKQASVLVLRFITEEYTTPLGVWVTREATRKALEYETYHSSQEEMFSYAKSLISTKFHYNIEGILKRSRLLEQINIQKTIFDFKVV